MRILIIALPRTGSTSLLLRYGKIHNLKQIFEPFEPLNLNLYNINNNNIVVKTMIYHIPPNCDNLINGYVDMSKKFDETILLSRKNLDECAESWAYLKTYNHKNFDSNKHYIWKPMADIDKYKNDIYKWDEYLTQISKILNIPITYYEDNFDMNSNERYRKNITIDKQNLI